jgi:hypothetical protein
VETLPSPEPQSTRTTRSLFKLGTILIVASACVLVGAAGLWILIKIRSPLIAPIPDPYGLIPILGVIAFYLLSFGFLARNPRILVRISGRFGRLFADALGLEDRRPVSSNEGQLALLMKKMETFEVLLNSIQLSVKSALTPDRQDEIVKAIRELVEHNIVQASVETVSKTYSDTTAKFYGAREIDTVAAELERQLRAERGTASARSFLNLAFGVGISGYGIYLLSGIVGQLSVNTANVADAALTFASKFSVVILIQVFGYFFLNLYRSGSQDMKYYQNEITNVTAWRLSLRAALATGDIATIGTLVKRLAETERNFVLKKGETTVDLKREARLSGQDVTLLRALRELVAGSSQKPQP